MSARERWPIIITQGIDDVHRSTWASNDEETAREGKAVVAELAKLKYELQHDRELTPIPDDGEADVAEYNKELEAMGNTKWHSVPWLFSECYLYRYDVWHKKLEPVMEVANANGLRKTYIKHLQADAEVEVI